MAEPHVISALRDKRSERAGLVIQLERQLPRYRGNLTHLDAKMLLFDPDFHPNHHPQPATPCASLAASPYRPSS